MKLMSLEGLPVKIDRSFVHPVTGIRYGEGSDGKVYTVDPISGLGTIFNLKSTTSPLYTVRSLDPEIDTIRPLIQLPKTNVASTLFKPATLTQIQTLIAASQPSTASQEQEAIAQAKAQSDAMAKQFELEAAAEQDKLNAEQAAITAAAQAGALAREAQAKAEAAAQAEALAQAQAKTAAQAQAVAQVVKEQAQSAQANITDVLKTAEGFVPQTLVAVDQAKTAVQSNVQAIADSNQSSSSHTTKLMVGGAVLLGGLLWLKFQSKASNHSSAVSGLAGLPKRRASRKTASKKVPAKPKTKPKRKASAKPAPFKLAIVNFR